ncbi:MAG: hypothetical protein RLZZ353_1226 [Actinomycetota bacterium]
MSRATSRRPGRLADLALGVALLVALLFGATTIAEPFANRRDADARVALLEEQRAALAAENARLEQRAADLEDPLTIELLAREQQGLVRQGDVPYILIPPETERPLIAEPSLAVTEAPDGPLDRLLALLRRWAG